MLTSRNVTTNRMRATDPTTAICHMTADTKSMDGRLDLPEHQVVFATFPSIPVISISNAQRRPVPGAEWIRTIHHGLPERLLTPQPVAPAYFAFLGRISPEKAVDQSIWIAKRCWVPLKIAAKVDAV